MLRHLLSVGVRCSGFYESACMKAISTEMLAIFCAFVCYVGLFHCFEFTNLDFQNNGLHFNIDENTL